MTVRREMALAFVRGASPWVARIGLPSSDFVSVQGTRVIGTRASMAAMGEAATSPELTRYQRVALGRADERGAAPAFGKGFLGPMPAFEKALTAPLGPPGGPYFSNAREETKGWIRLERRLKWILLVLVAANALDRYRYRLAERLGEYSQTYGWRPRGGWPKHVDEDLGSGPTFRPVSFFGWTINQRHPELPVGFAEVQRIRWTPPNLLTASST